MRKELEAEPFERFNKLLDKVRGAKSAEEALLSLLKAQVRFGLCCIRGRPPLGPPHSVGYTRRMMGALGIGDRVR